MSGRAHIFDFTDYLLEVPLAIRDNFGLTCVGDSTEVLRGCLSVVLLGACLHSYEFIDCLLGGPVAILGDLGRTLVGESAENWRGGMSVMPLPA